MGSSIRPDIECGKDYRFSKCVIHKGEIQSWLIFGKAILGRKGQ